MGPTASGKTAAAIRVCQKFNTEIISVDSAMVYRGMDIGTAKPSADELAQAPHRLIDICDPCEAYSAARFAEDALREIKKLRAVGKQPLLVGGTLLYYRALQQGLAPLPAADPDIRRALEAKAQQHGWPALHKQLAQIDPLAADRIKPTDTQRISRALEVHQITGCSLSDLCVQQDAYSSPYEFINIALVPDDRARLRSRIAKRFKEMLNRGFIAEVERLYSRADLGPALPAIRCVGYRQVWEYLAGTLDYAEMEEEAIIKTGQLAKRQLTWIRGIQDVIRLNSDDPNVQNTLISTVTACFN